MDLEKLITTNPIWDFFTETFDLLSAGQFENLVFQPKGAKSVYPGFPDDAGPAALPDEFSNPDPGPSQTHPGMKYFLKETLAVDK